jgi:hypothetical protein
MVDRGVETEVIDQVAALLRAATVRMPAAAASPMRENTLSATSGGVWALI